MLTAPHDVLFVYCRIQITVIPQDAHLFSGTIRQSLDPMSTASDARLWEVLDQVTTNSNTIDARVREYPNRLREVVDQVTAIFKHKMITNIATNIATIYQPNPVAVHSLVPLMKRVCSEPVHKAGTASWLAEVYECAWHKPCCDCGIRMDVHSLCKLVAPILSCEFLSLDRLETRSQKSFRSVIVKTHSFGLCHDNGRVGVLFRSLGRTA